MAREINWKRVDYENRTDTAADEISEFVALVLETIDQDAARASPAQWEVVRCFFAGCALAAQQQGHTPGEGATRIVEYLTAAFDVDVGDLIRAFELDPNQSGDGFRDGFNEFMDWLSNPAQFQPTALRAAIARCG